MVDDLDLQFEVMALHGDPGLDLVAFTAEPGSPDDGGLRLLATWAAEHAARTRRRPWPQLVAEL